MHKRMQKPQALHKIIKEEKRIIDRVRLFGAAVGLEGDLNLFNNLLWKLKEVGSNVS